MTSLGVQTRSRRVVQAAIAPHGLCPPEKVGDTDDDDDHDNDDDHDDDDDNDDDHDDSDDYDDDDDDDDDVDDAGHDLRYKVANIRYQTLGSRTNLSISSLMKNS